VDRVSCAGRNPRRQVARSFAGGAAKQVSYFTRVIRELVLTAVVELTPYLNLLFLVRHLFSVVKGVKV